MPDGPPARPRVFVSAVSSELGIARQLVADCLLVFHNVEAEEQTKFGTESGALLAMLRHRIDGSVGVLQLVGTACGMVPPEEVPDFGRISFTQFELLYAIEQGKRTWLIEVARSCTRDAKAPEFVISEGPEKARLEREYHDRLRLSPAGGPLAFQESDDAALRAVIAAHNERRELQRTYFDGQHAHLRAIPKNDDELVLCVKRLVGLPQVDEPPICWSAGLGIALEENFVGRAPLTFSVLAQLRRSARARIVLQGLGGCGKTALASEIGHAFNRIGHPVFMVKPAPGRALDEMLAKLADDLEEDEVSDARTLRKWLRSNSGWLMIIDGVDDRDMARSVEEFCERLPPGSFLITSYLKGFWGGGTFETRDVDVLSPADAARLLGSRLSREGRPLDPERDMARLAEWLGRLPLAIEHAKGYLATNKGESIDTYIAKLEAAHLLPQAESTNMWREAPKPIAATWRTSLERMRPSSRTLLRLLSYLTDDPIPRALITSPEVATVFARACATDPLEPPSFEDDPLRDASDIARWQKEIGAALDELCDYCLLRTHDSSNTQIRAHRLVLMMTQNSLRSVAPQVIPVVAEFQRAVASLDVHGRFLGHAIRFLTDYVAEDQDRRKEIYPHLIHLASLYLERHPDGQPAIVPLRLASDELIFLADLFSLMGVGHEGQAIAHYVRAAESAEATTFERARASQGAAYASFQDGALAESLEYYARAEAAIEGLTDEEGYEEVRYEIHSGRGWVNRFIGNLEDAIPQLKRAYDLAVRSKHLGRMADAHVNLGAAYDYAGDDEAARRYYREGLRLADKSGDHSYRGVARYLGGWFLIRRGPFDEGMTLCGEALAIGEEFEFGTILSEAAWILAVGHAMAGRLDTALDMAERAADSSSGFVQAWVLMIRGIMRFRQDRDDAADDFIKAIEQSDKDVERFKNFDPFDTRAFAHAGLALLGAEGHEDLAVRDYRSARELASGGGIVHIGRTVFSCFGSTPAVERIAKRLFAGS
jgi:tetratricopeptide (TPR) repeat protein